MRRAAALTAAAWRPALLATALYAGACGCSGLQGFGGPPTPLVTFQVLVSGDLAPLLPPGAAGPRSLQVALVWGAQWLTEPFCLLPAENDQAAAVIAAGCRDPFAFTPLRVAADVPVEIGMPATLSLFDLPAADVMVGPITARVAYGSMVVYDDRDGDGTLGLSIPHRLPGGGPGPPQPNLGDAPDIVYGASFVSMTAPDQRVVFREGAFADTGFYPRSGCPHPKPGFSVVHAGGFSRDAALMNPASLPPEDPAGCTAAGDTDPIINIAVQPPALVEEVSCVQRRDDSSVRYREPPTEMPDLSSGGRVHACAPLPTFDAPTQGGLIQLVVSGRTSDRCMGLTHYTLRGCRENVACPVPDWDFTATPPAWWPCPQ